MSEHGGRGYVDPPTVPHYGGNMRDHNAFTRNEPDNFWHPWSEIYERPAAIPSLASRLFRFVAIVSGVIVASCVVIVAIIIGSVRAMFGSFDSGSGYRPSSLIPNTDVQLPSVPGPPVLAEIAPSLPAGTIPIPTPRETPLAEIAPLAPALPID